MLQLIKNVGYLYLSAAELLVLGNLMIHPVAATAGDETDDLLDLPLETLMSMEVTSVSKRLQKFFETAAAIHVITAEDIRRSGVTHIAEALRLAPGLQVARIDANNWSVSSRGFGGLWSNKLLVLVDGRSIYSPTYSGVYWSSHGLMLEDVERIEVIRGPGATLWGSNAVNGIINIITRNVADTHGGLLTVRSGNKEKAVASLRYGGAVGDLAHGRAYLRYTSRDDQYDPVRETAAVDGWDSREAGFRVDGDTETGHSWTLQGDVFAMNGTERFEEIASPVPPYTLTDVGSVDSRGWNLLGRWTHRWLSGGESTLQFYLDHVDREQDVLSQETDILDIDFQHQPTATGRHNLLWGLGLRHIRQDFDNSFGVSVNPTHHEEILVSGFLQDEITLVPDQLRLTIGSKFEHNEQTGFEIQPSVRLSWMPSERFTLWAALSRAVRTPSRIETRGHIVQAVFPTGPFPAPLAEIAVDGDPELNAEVLLAHELGFRYQAENGLALDLALFYNRYRELLTMVGTGAGSSRFANDLEGSSSGLELSLDWWPTPNWHLQAAHTLLRVDLDPGDDPFTTRIARMQEGESPRHQTSLRSGWNLGREWDLDLWLYRVGAIRDLSFTPPDRVDAYTSLNINLAWHPTSNLSVSLTGRDLLDERKPEYNPGSYLPPAEIERSIHLGLNWKF
ncbi:MAG: TonB-dependent receptor [Gammaproteobacteria bacterium]|nr:TonB-dependent receptor [Gammaproteobacteria bacterium]